MAMHMKKCNYGVLPIVGLILSIFLVEGQNAFESLQNEDEQMVNSIEKDPSEFASYFREAISLFRGVRSDIQNLKDEIEMLKNRIEDHDKSTNSSNEELKRQLLTYYEDLKSQFQKEQPEQPEGRDCPEGFTHRVAGFPKCYAVLSEKVDWGTAQERCRQLDDNAQLAVITNSREQQIIYDIVKNLDCTTKHAFPGEKSDWVNAFWVGARRKHISDCDSPFEWTSNDGTTSSIRYSNWAVGEPSCAKKMEACVSLNKHSAYKWNDLTCTWTVCAVCEVSIQA